MWIDGSAASDNTQSQTETDQRSAIHSEDSESPLPQTTTTTTAEKDNQTPEDDMSMRKSSPILDRLERRTELMRAENRRIQEALFDRDEGEMLLRNEDDILERANRGSRAPTPRELQMQFNANGAISIGAELHAIKDELRSHGEGSRGGSSRGGPSRGGSSRGGSSRVGPSKSKKKTSKKH